MILHTSMRELIMLHYLFGCRIVLVNRLWQQFHEIKQSPTGYKIQNYPSSIYYYYNLLNGNLTADRRNLRIWNSFNGRVLDIKKKTWILWSSVCYNNGFITFHRGTFQIVAIWLNHQVQCHFVLFKLQLPCQTFPVGNGLDS